MQRIRLMLPAYNEEQSLPSLLDRVTKVNRDFELNLEVLLVNDGSTDSTLQIAKDKGVEILDLVQNRGLAGAMREGLKESIKDLKKDDILVTMDADDSHHPGLIFRMITQINEGSDLVIASRYQKGARVVGLSRFRLFLTHVAGILYRVFAPIRGVKDYTCGYRAYRVGLLRDMMDHYGEGFIKQKGFACMGEILLRTRRFNPIVHELPMILRYDKKLGESKMNVLQTIKQTLSLIFTTKR